MAGRNNGYNDYNQGDMFDNQGGGFFSKLFRWLRGKGGWAIVGAFVLIGILSAYFTGVDMSSLFASYSGVWIVIIIVVVIVAGLLIYGSHNNNRNNRF